jgi:hypothetical protein
MRYDDIEQPEEMKLLAETVLTLTKRGEIQWAVTDDSGSFLYSTTKSSLLINGSPAPEPEGGEYSLTLVNSKGDTVAEYNNELEEDNGFRTQLLSDLWYEARNNALDVEDTFRDIRQALGIPPGEPDSLSRVTRE